MTYVDLGLRSDKRERCRELKYKGEDRRVPFKRNESAALAGDNVLEADLDIQAFTDLATELILSFSKKRSAKISQKIQRLARKIRQRQLEAAAHAPIAWDGNAPSLVRYFGEQLSPAGNHKIVAEVESALGLESHFSCAAEICKLPREIREPLVRLDVLSLQSVLARSIVDSRSVEYLFKLVWKYRLIAVAQRRALALSDAAREPNGYQVAGPQTSPSTGHIFLRTVTAPAIAVNGIAALLPTVSLPEIDDQAAIDALVSNGLLAEHHAPILWTAGRTVRHRITVDANAGMTIDVLNCLRYLAEGARPAALLVNGDMKTNGLDKLEPIDHLLGLTGAEATAFIAEQLILACEAVDASSWPIFGSAKPKRRSAWPSEREVGIVANILAHENVSYRYASGTRGVRDASKHDPLAPTHKPMRGAVIGMRQKLDGGHRDRMVRSFGIDPHACLG